MSDLEHVFPMTALIPAQCKDCVFRQHNELENAWARAYCDKYGAERKPSSIMKNTADCKYYKKG